jgi:hypothetical protein
MRRKYYQRRRRAGLCVRCGIACVDDRVLCAPCAEAQAQADRETRAELRKHRVCQKCRRETTVLGYRYCPLCTGDRRDEANARYAARRAAKVCVQCCAPAAGAHCDIHAEERRARRRHRKAAS